MGGLLVIEDICLINASKKKEFFNNLLENNEKSQLRCHYHPVGYSRFWWDISQKHSLPGSFANGIAPSILGAGCHKYSRAYGFYANLCRTAISFVLLQCLQPKLQISSSPRRYMPYRASKLLAWVRQR